MTNPKSTVLLTGATGLLGTWLRRCAPPHIHVVSVVHRRPLAADAVVADLRDRSAVTRAFTTVRPHLVIHAGCARDDASIVEATRNVADGAAEAGATVVFVSSEAVFAGDGLPRSETAPPDPVWDYGRWKAAAEAIVQGRDPSAAIVRLPLIVSRSPEDHIIADIRRGLERGEPSTWFTDEMRQPANADELARAIWAIATLAGEALAGSWHLPGPERLSRFEIATRAADALGLDRRGLVAAPTPSGARRPRDLVLTGSRAEQQIGWEPGPVCYPAG